ELTVEQIGRVLGVSRTSIYRALADGPAASTDGTSEPSSASRTIDGLGQRRAPRRRPPERS
ncbi:MAG: hypothetical protein M3P83_06445, partial [Actinomycetota bacterium]|nr:hypothetical protein [Actinomycetota bacterium]